MGADLWAVVAVFFFWMWVASFLVGIFCSTPARGEFKSVPAMIWGAVLLISCGLWVVGLLKAS